MKLCFMTFVCPSWDIKKIVRFAGKTDYDGVEIRVDIKHNHQVSTQSTPEQRRFVKKLFNDQGVNVACIATSVRLACPEPARHQENMNIAKANLELAADLGAEVVRIFAGSEIPALTDDAADQVGMAFDELGSYADPLGVCPMLECGHDIIKGAAEADAVIRRVKSGNFGALWNHSQIDDQAFSVVKDRIRHFHVHDEVLDQGNKHLLELAKRMKSVNYRGYVSLEIIKKKDLPEELLTETATRLKQLIMQA